MFQQVAHGQMQQHALVSSGALAAAYAMKAARKV
jgi:hypothetical protein